MPIQAAKHPLLMNLVSPIGQSGTFGISPIFNLNPNISHQHNPVTFNQESDFTQAELATNQNSVGHTVSITSPQRNFGILRLRRSLGSIIGAIRGRNHFHFSVVGKNFIVQSGETITLRKNLAKIIDAADGFVSAQLVTLRRSVSHTISMVSAQVVTLLESIVRAKTITVTALHHAVTLFKGRFLTLLLHQNTLYYSADVGGATGIEGYSIRGMIIGLGTASNGPFRLIFRNLGPPFGSFGTMTVDHVGIGIQSGAFSDMVSPPIEVTFGGQSGFTIPFSSVVINKVASDLINLPFGASDNLIVVFDMNNTPTNNLSFGRPDIGAPGRNSTYRLAASGPSPQSPVPQVTYNIQTEAGTPYTFSTGLGASIIGYFYIEPQSILITVPRSIGKIISTLWAQLVTLTPVFSGGSVTNPLTINVTQAETFRLLKSVSHTITTMVNAQVVTLIKSAGHFVSMTQAQLVTLRRSAGKLVTVPSGQLVTLLRSTGHLISMTSAELVTLTRSAAHLISMTSPELVTLLKSVGHKISMTSAQVVTLFRSVGHVISLLSAQLVTLTDFGTHTRTISVTQAENVTLLKSVGHFISMTSAQVVTLLRSVGHKISMTSGELVTLLRSGAHTISMTSAQLVTLTRSTTKLFTLTQGQLVTLIKSVGHKISLTSAQVVTLLPIKSGSLLLSFSQGELLTLRRSMGKLVTFTQSEVVTLIKSAGHRVSMTSAEVVTLTRSVGHKISMTSAQVVTLLRSIGHFVSMTSAELVTLTALRRLLRTISITQGENVTLTRSVGKRLSITQAQVVTLLRSGLKLLTITQAQVVTLKRAGAHAISLVQAQLVTLRRSVGHLISMTSAELVTLTRRMPKTILLRKPNPLDYTADVGGGSGAQNFSVRSVIVGVGADSQAPVTFTFRNLGPPYVGIDPVTVSHVSVGVQSGAFSDTVDPPVEITFNGGQSGYFIPFNPKLVNSVTSDPVNISFKANDNLVVILDFASTTPNFIALGRPAVGQPGRNSFYRIAPGSGGPQTPIPQVTYNVQTEAGTPYTWNTNSPAFIAGYITINNASNFATLTKSLSKTIATTWDELVTLVTNKTFALTLSFSSAQLVTLLRTVAHTVSLAGAQLVTLTKSLMKTVTAVQGQIVTLTKLSAHGLRINITQAQAIRLTRSIGKFLSTAWGESVRLTRGALKRIQMVSGEHVTLVAGILFSRLITAVQAQLLSTRRDGARVINIASAQSIRVARRISKTISMSFGQLVRATKNFPKTIHLIIVDPMVLTMTVGRRITTMTLGQVVTMRRSIGKQIRVAYAQAITMLRGSSRTLALSVAQHVTLTKSAIKTFVLTQAQAVTRTSTRLRLRTISFTTSQLVTLRRQIGKLIRAVSRTFVTLFIVPFTRIHASLVCAAIDLYAALRGALTSTPAVGATPEVMEAVAASPSVSPAVDGAPSVDPAVVGTPESKPAVVGTPNLEKC